jgi:uncharacterized protein (TIGR03085 family)
MKRIAGVEPQLRADFAAVSRQVGPEAPTLCEGWLTGDVLLHMNLIERRWDSWVSVALGRRIDAVQRYYDQLVARERSRPWEEQVVMIERGPRSNPLRSQSVRDMMMPREYLIHTEDIRRANGIEVAVSADAQDVAWSRLPGLAKRMFMTSDPYGVALERPDGRRHVLKNGSSVAVLRGEPLELLLHVFGRTSVTKVELVGDPEAVAAAYVRDTSKMAQAQPRAFA